MQQQQLRNTDFLTTVPNLYNLFIGYNDMIDMQWVEEQAPLTGNTKWDGVAFLIKNRLVTRLFVELSGGINFNSGIEKARNDVEKMVRLVKLLRLKQAEGYLKIYFECLFYLGDCYVKQTYFELVCPTAPKKLKEVFKSISDLFQYRQAILDQLDN